MPDNKSLIAELSGEVVRSIDLGEYADAFAGRTLQVQVNPPCIVEELANKSYEELPRSTIVNVVTLFVGGAREETAKLDDGLLYWIYGKCLNLYNTYHEELKKK